MYVTTCIIYVTSNYSLKDNILLRNNLESIFIDYCAIKYRGQLVSQKMSINFHFVTLLDAIIAPRIVSVDRLDFSLENLNKNN